MITNKSKSPILSIGYTNVSKIILGVMLVFAGNQLSINIKPVPITLLTMMISLIGFTYSPKLSFITIATYLLSGLIGLPVFANYSFGLAYLLGPTGGYLVGILFATTVMSWLKDKLDIAFINIVFISLVGHLIIYALGVGWLLRFLPLDKAIYSGLVVFVPSGIIKIGIFALLFSYINKYKFRNQ